MESTTAPVSQPAKKTPQKRTKAPDDRLHKVLKELNSIKDEIVADEMDERKRKESCVIKAKTMWPGFETFFRDHPMMSEGNNRELFRKTWGLKV